MRITQAFRGAFAAAVVFGATLSSAQAANFPALYRYDFDGGKHFYTSSCDEVAALRAKGKYPTKIEGYLWSETSKSKDTTVFYRLIASDNGTHFYTSSEAEKDQVVKDGRFKLEASPGYIARTTGSQRIPLFRMYNPGTGDHFYTTHADEINAAMANAWGFEKVEGYLLSNGTNCPAPK